MLGKKTPGSQLTGALCTSTGPAPDSPAVQLFHHELNACKDAALGLTNRLYERVVDKGYGLVRAARGSGGEGAGGAEGEGSEPPRVLAFVVGAADSVAKAVGQEVEDASRRLAGEMGSRQDCLQCAA